MDQIDAFPEHISTTVMPVTLPEKTEALEYAGRQGQVRACIIYQEPNTKYVFSCFVKTIGTKKRRCWIIQACLHGGEARERIQSRQCLVGETLQGNFEKSHALSSNGVRTPHGLTDPGWNPLHLVEGSKDCKNETVQSKGLQASSSYPGSYTCKGKQTIFGTDRAFHQEEPSIYHTRHQTTCGSCVDCQTFHCWPTHQPVIIPESPVLTTPQILLPDPPRPPAPIQPQPPELTTPQILLSDPPRPPVQVLNPPRPPVQVLNPPVQTPQQHLQILLPPVVETLEPTLKDDSSIDQIMASVFGDYSQQGIPPTHTQEPQGLIRCLPCLTRVMISSRSWIILKQCWPQSNKKNP
ncbi:uncharacterized protein TNCV_813291 [Trichonephila clavipes]|nr:uncharacterized protein TNCV_813291 [Trichonephila clavipes]